MKIAIALDGPLGDLEGLKTEWFNRLGDEGYLKDNSFWVALKPYDDIAESMDLIKSYDWDLYVFAERPKGVFLPTRAWLRNNAGVELNKDRLIMQAIKRYDCRLLGIDIFVDSDMAAIENLKIETVSPVAAYHIDREGNDSLHSLIKEIHEEMSRDHFEQQAL